MKAHACQTSGPASVGAGVRLAVHRARVGWAGGCVALVLTGCFLGPSAPAQLLPLDNAAVRSVSGQFLVLNPPTRARTPDLSGDSRLVKLEPSLLTVMCERVKQALTEEIGPGGQWRGKVYLTLRPAWSADEEVNFVAEHFKDGWVYRLELPNPVERTRLVRALVQAVLLEQANRNAGERSAEIPLWCSEGLRRQMLATRGLEIILPPPQTKENQLRLDRVVVESRRTNAVTLARLALGEQGPLSLEELSWPKDNVLAGPEAERYQLSAQIFVAELLRFEDGRDCLRQMLADLPRFLNWQLAFLGAFKPHFARQLDVEKWWALQTELMTGRTENGLWSATESWNKLDQILRVPVQVRRERADLPRVTDVSLGTVIVEWDAGRQLLALRGKVTELQAARVRVSAELLSLVDDYRRVLAAYINRRENPAATLGGRRGEMPDVRRLVRDTLKQLENLEAQRLELKPAATAPVAAAVAVPPVPVSR